MSSSSNSTEKPKSSRPPRREVWWHDLGAKNQSLESIKRRFEDCLDRFLSSSSISPLRHVSSPMDSKLKHNLHQCPGYLREEITLVSDVSKSVVVSHAFPSQSEVCTICNQLVQYKYTEPSSAMIVDVKMQEARYPLVQPVQEPNPSESPSNATSSFPPSMFESAQHPASTAVPPSGFYMVSRRCHFLLPSLILSATRIKL